MLGMGERRQGCCRRRRHFIALIRSWRAAVMVSVANAVGIRTRDGNQLSVSATRSAAVLHAQTRKQQ